MYCTAYYVLYLDTPVLSSLLCAVPGYSCTVPAYCVLYLYSIVLYCLLCTVPRYSCTLQLTVYCTWILLYCTAYCVLYLDSLVCTVLLIVYFIWIVLYCSAYCVLYLESPVLYCTLENREVWATRRELWELNYFFEIWK